jgi:hypothetical protein
LLAQRFALGTVALMVGAGFGAGFWFGRQPIEQRADSRSEATPPASMSLDTARGAHARSTSASPAPPSRAAPAGADASSNPDVAARARAEASDPARAATPPAATASGSARAKTPNATTSVETSSAGAATTPRRARATIDPSDDALMREVALLERIDRAIRGGEANLALALLTELDQTVPEPALRHERAAARLLARCVAARDGSSSARQQARTNAHRFLGRNATSVYADRIRSACALEGTDTARHIPIEEPGRVGH